jgi:hypothetical protein
MVLRPDPGHLALQKDPQLPHKAAKYAYEKALKKHYAYDFAMNFNDATDLFCSEVVYEAYKKMGLELWEVTSSISGQGLARWLFDFGVRQFYTHEPSDLEYDSRLKVVAEWRDQEMLYQDHLDNAITDVMLEDAGRGEELDYNLWLLPLARIVKAYCFVLNKFDQHGSIPENMSATAALKNESYSTKHEIMKKELRKRADEFKKHFNYTPPYWKILEMGREIKKELYPYKS